MYAVLILLAATVTSIDAVNDGIFYPFGTDQGDSVVPLDDAGASQINIPIAIGFPFVRTNPSTAFVSIQFNHRCNKLLQCLQKN